MQTPDAEQLRPVLEAIMQIEDPLQRAAFMGAADLLLGLERNLGEYAKDHRCDEAAIRKAHAAGTAIGESIMLVAGELLTSMQVGPEATAEELLAAMGMGAEAEPEPEPAATSSSSSSEPETAPAEATAH